MPPFWKEGDTEAALRMQVILQMRDKRINNACETNDAQ